MLVIPVYRVVDKTRIIRKNGGLRRRRSTKGCRPPLSKYIKKQYNQISFLNNRPNAALPFLSQ
jgi:hypothetical protein